MAPQFKVYVATLAEMAKDMDAASQAFSAIPNLVDQARAAENALGFIGRKSGFPGKYRRACDTIAGGAQKSAASLAKAADALLDTAQDYVDNDDYYAKKFKIQHDGKPLRLPELGGGNSARDEAGRGQTEPSSPGTPKPSTPQVPKPVPPLQVPAKPKLPTQI
jgi:hypothetical protein